MWLRQRVYPSTPSAEVTVSMVRSQDSLQTMFWLANSSFSQIAWSTGRVPAGHFTGTTISVCSGSSEAAFFFLLAGRVQVQLVEERLTLIVDSDLGISRRDHLACEPPDTYVAGSGHVGEHSVSHLESLELLPVLRSATRVEEAVPLGDLPAVISRLDPTEDYIEVSAVRRAGVVGRRGAHGRRSYRRR